MQNYGNFMASQGHMVCCKLADLSARPCYKKRKKEKEVGEGHTAWMFLSLIVSGTLEMQARVYIFQMLEMTK